MLHAVHFSIVQILLQYSSIVPKAEQNNSHNIKTEQNSSHVAKTKQFDLLSKNFTFIFSDLLLKKLVTYVFSLKKVPFLFH